MYVIEDSASMLVGYGVTRSMYERVASSAVALSRWRALNSNTSVLNSRVTSMTAASSGPQAATLNVMMIGSLFEAFTASAIGLFGSATTL